MFVLNDPRPTRLSIQKQLNKDDKSFSSSYDNADDD